MLSLSRRKKEAIVIGGNVVVMVLEIRGDVVRLGIQAPKETPVHRGEIFDAIHGEGATRAVSEGKPVAPVSPAAAGQEG